MTDDDHDPRIRCEPDFWIDCTICGPDHPDTPRFTSEIALWAELLRPSVDGWIRLDDGRILCPVHRGIAECELDGHRLTPWTEHPLDDELDWRYCHRCGANFEQRTTAEGRQSNPAAADPAPVGRADGRPQSRRRTRVTAHGRVYPTPIPSL